MQPLPPAAWLAPVCPLLLLARQGQVTRLRSSQHALQESTSTVGDAVLLLPNCCVCGHTGAGCDTGPRPVHQRRRGPGAGLQCPTRWGGCTLAHTNHTHRVAEQRLHPTQRGLWPLNTSLSGWHMGVMTHMHPRTGHLHSGAVGVRHQASFCDAAAGVKVPSSLQNIYKELAADVGAARPSHGCLQKVGKRVLGFCRCAHLCCSQG